MTLLKLESLAPTLPTLVSHSHTHTQSDFQDMEKKQTNKQLDLPLRKFVRQFRSRRIHHRNHLIIYSMCWGVNIQGTAIIYPRMLVLC